jgi:His/Glu/Gln/Arg/opine family amino acid ABC transporter permease subunit
MSGDEFATLLGGAWMTVQLLTISAVIGLTLSVPIALARVSPYAPLRWAATTWSGFFRGTPLLVQLFLCYYGLPQFLHGTFLWPLIRDAYPCALLAFTLNMSAYVSEVVRGGILAVPRGEREAAEALGFGPVLLYRLVILPRALRIMLPALSNEVVLMLKATSLASTVTVLDLTGAGRRLFDKSYSTEPLFVAGAIYIVLAFVIARLFRLVETRLGIPSH